MERYQAQQPGGLPIKVMTLGLFGITAYYAYLLHEKRAYAWQQGHKLSDLWDKDR